MPKTLVLVPTPAEIQRIGQVLSNLDHVMIKLCGFGPIGAAAMAATHIASYRPDRVILTGIAGSVGKRLEIGTAIQFSSVACFGVGIGWGDQHASAAEIGWQQIDNGGENSIGDHIPLDHSLPEDRLLVTVCSASNSLADVQRYRTRYPAAIAEDMEGFGVAMACRISKIPLSIVRGISNHAGDRDKSNWRIDAALEAAAEMTLKQLNCPSSTEYP